MKDWTSLGLLWLRVLAGSSMLTHGWGKVMGGHVSMLADGLTKMGFPMPMAFAWAAALSEFAGSACVILGLGTRVAASLLFITMSVALFIAHRADPFQTKELAYLYWTIFGSIILMGGGSYTIGNLIRGKKS